ncbi:glycosyltransferase family 4 protein [Lactiplantibacillus plantarum]|nr:glycosyltransferase family 4 protein [Lactiplantibacillus plantarum]
MKKILYLHAGAEMYGADKILLELVEGIDKTKFEPLVILPEKGLLVDELLKRKIDVRVMPYPIVRRKYFTPWGMLRFLFTYLCYAIKLTRIVRAENIKVVHVNTTAVWEGVWIRVFSRSKIVWHVHEIITHPAIVYRVVCFLLQHFSDKVITVSEATKQHLLEGKIIEPSKIEVVRNGIDGNLVVSKDDTSFRRKLGLNENIVVIGMVGRINAWKGQTDFLQAVVPVLENSAETFAVIVGSPYRGEEERLNMLIQEIDSLPEKISSRIKIIPFQREVSKVYALIDIFVLPSTSPDPFPTVALEAMANGLPIVGYAHGGVTEMVEDNETGYLVEVNSPRQMSLKIKALVDSKMLRVRFGLAAQDRQLRLFELTHFVRRFEQIYLDV